MKNKFSGRTGYGAFKLRCFLLRLALGKHFFKYMVKTLRTDPRITRAHLVDMVVRKDGVERRIEADWICAIAKITDHVKMPELKVFNVDGTEYLAHPHEINIIPDKPVKQIGIGLDGKPEIEVSNNGTTSVEPSEAYQKYLDQQ